MPGIVALKAPAFVSYEVATLEMAALNEQLQPIISQLEGIPMIVLCDDAAFTAANLNNFLWVTFTRTNPSHDIWGIDAFTEFKHWGCRGPLIVDARIKPHHAPPLMMNDGVNRKIDRLFAKGGSLAGIEK
jgi:4-hydroxy-3-polyprenylbenzoate decarboxylase